MTSLTVTKLTRDSREYGNVSFSDGVKGTWGRDVSDGVFLVLNRRTVRDGKRHALLSSGLCEMFPHDCPQCRPW